MRPFGSQRRQPSTMPAQKIRKANTTNMRNSVAAIQLMSAL